MRTIKFRGKRLDNGEWIYGDLVHLYDGLAGIAFDPSELRIMPVVQVDPNTVGQCTDWKDRNGNDIYEGDILDSEYFQNPKFHPIGLCELRWDADGWECRTPWDDSCTLYSAVTSYPAEVIGNIHDNPELLKGGKR